MRHWLARRRISRQTTRSTAPPAGSALLAVAAPACAHATTARFLRFLSQHARRGTCCMRATPAYRAARHRASPHARHALNAPALPAAQRAHCCAACARAGMPVHFLDEHICAAGRRISRRPCCAAFCLPTTCLPPPPDLVLDYAEHAGNLLRCLDILGWPLTAGVLPAALW